MPKEEGIDKKANIVRMVMKGIPNGLEGASRLAILKVRQSGKLCEPPPLGGSKWSRGLIKWAKKKRVYYPLWEEGIFLKN